MDELLWHLEHDGHRRRGDGKKASRTEFSDAELVDAFLEEWAEVERWSKGLELAAVVIDIPRLRALVSEIRELREAQEATADQVRYLGTELDRRERDLAELRRNRRKQALGRMLGFAAVAVAAWLISTLLARSFL